MKTEEAIELEGTIRSVLAGTMFRVELPSKHIVLAHISGRMRKRFIRLTIGAFILAITAVPVYLWHFGVDWFLVALFAVSTAVTGFSITVGYHRLFSHISFRAKWPVRLFVLIFGAAAFENSVLMWASEHRR